MTTEAGREGGPWGAGGAAGGGTEGRDPGLWGSRRHGGSRRPREGPDGASGSVSDETDGAKARRGLGGGGGVLRRPPPAREGLYGLAAFDRQKKQVKRFC